MREMETAAKSMETCSEQVERMAEMFQADMPPALEALEDASREAEELAESLKVLVSPLTSINGGPAVKRKRAMRSQSSSTAAGGAVGDESALGNADLAASEARAGAAARAQSLQLAMQELFPSWGKVDATSLVNTVNLLFNDWKARVDLLSTKITRGGQPVALAGAGPGEVRAAGRDGVTPREVGHGFEGAAVEQGPDAEGVGSVAEAGVPAADPPAEGVSEADQLREVGLGDGGAPAAGAAGEGSAAVSAPDSVRGRAQISALEPSSVRFLLDDDISDSFLDWEYRLRLDNQEACDEDEVRDAAEPGASGLGGAQATGGAERVRPRVPLTARVSRLLFSREAAADNIAEMSDSDELYDSDDDGASGTYFDSSFDPSRIRALAQTSAVTDGSVAAQSRPT